MSGIGALATLRRPIGLFAFFYATLHFLTYAVDQTYLSGLGVSPAAIVEDVVERPYITVGVTAFVLLIPLAVTSTKRWIKRLGAKRWQRLHRLVYVAAIAAVLHFLWLVKADMFQPLVLAVVLAVLLGARVVSRRPDGPRRRREPPRALPTEPTGLSSRS
jgi:sulfoxide reductase heme-binding subunit YedZ